MTRPTRFANKKRISNENDENLTINLLTFENFLGVSRWFSGGVLNTDCYKFKAGSNFSKHGFSQGAILGFPHVF